MEEREKDPTVDFLSPLFDPLKALRADTVELPFPQARPFDSLQQYQALHSGKAPPVRERKLELVTETRQEVEKKKDVSVIDKELKLKTVLDFMASTYD